MRGIFKDDIWMSVEENNCDEFFTYPNFFVWKNNLSDLFYYRKTNRWRHKAYAEDGEARKAYREKLQDEEDTQRMKAHDNFVRTVQAAYEKEKDNYSSVTGIILQNDTEEKLQYLAC